MAVVPDSHCNEWATGTRLARHHQPTLVPTHHHSHWNLHLSYHQNVAGKGEPIRLALNHAGIPFTDVGHLRYHSMALPLTLRCPRALAITALPPLLRTHAAPISAPPILALPVCCLSHAPEVPGPAIVCSLARAHLSPPPS